MGAKPPRKPAAPPTLAIPTPYRHSRESGNPAPPDTDTPAAAPASAIPARPTVIPPKAGIRPRPARPIG